MTNLASTTVRRASLAGTSLAALVLALATPAAVRAQSFNGTGAVTSGSATISTSAGRTDVTVNSTEAIIDWTTTAPASGSVVFQNAGTTAAFADGVSSAAGNYTVLNRVTPVDVNGAPTAARIEFDGTVTSTIGGLRGGNVWFYSPNGIIVGASASFSVGGLVLTTSPIDTSGGLYKGSTVRFRGTAGSTGIVQIQPGASIVASPNPQLGFQGYVAIVAPRVEQGGNVQANGPIGYIAAEDADITINAGLFDILINAGTTDSNGIVHTGTTTGPASAGTTDPRTIYMVAVPKNDGLTMLLSGSIGYAAAASASNDGAAVILSAGHGTYDSASALTNPANIAIGDAVFSSVTTANATDSITVTPTTLTQFDRFTTLNAFNAVNLTASGTAKILANDTIGMGADYSLDVSSSNGGNGGAITLTTSGSGAITAAGRVRLQANGSGFAAASGADGTGGTITLNTLGGSFSAANLDVNATGSAGFLLANGGNGQGGTITILSQGNFSVGALTVNANGSSTGGDGIGGTGTGGTINLTASNGGSITTQSIGLTASGIGGNGFGGGGNGRGGTIAVLASGNGTIAAPSGFIAQAFGSGGSGGSGSAGDGFGGSVSLTSTSGPLDFGSVNLTATGSGGNTGGAAGNATGGAVLISLAGTSQDWTDLTVDASASAGATFGTGASSGNAVGDLVNGVSLDIQGVTLNLTGGATLRNDALGQVGDGAGTFARAGRAAITVGSGGALVTGDAVSVSAQADLFLDGLSSSPNYSPQMTGGTASVLVDGGSISTPILDVNANARGMGTLIGAGSATGGTAQVVVRGGGTLDVVVDPLVRLSGTLNITANADGNYQTFIGSTFGTVADGFASAAQAGTARLQLDSGAITVAGDTAVKAAGTAGPSATIGGADSIGNGTGGSALVVLGGGTMTLDGGLLVDASGDGGTITGGARGGTGQGGTAAFDATGGTLNLSNFGLQLIADGSSEPVSSSTTGSAGNATGGTARLTSQGAATINIPISVTLSANGLSGSGSGATGAGGIATGGTATILAQGGTMTLGTTNVDANAMFGGGVPAQASANHAGTARVEAAGGAITVTGDLSISANAFLSADILDLHGEDATGGQALLLANNSGSVSVTGATLIDATGQAGFDTLASGIGGNGTGGSIQVEALSSGAITLSGNALLHANGYGGDASGTEGLGGAGYGGAATVNQGTGGTVHVVGALTVDSNAYGGANAVTSTVGGRATGGTSTLTSQAGTLSIDGNATLVSNPTGGANPDGSTAPTVAGFIGLGTGTASPGGTTAIGGSLNATAIGDTARPDGMGLGGTIDGGSIAVVGDTLLRTTGAFALSGVNGGSLVTGGALSLASDTGAITWTGLLQSGGAATLQAPAGITLGTLQSGGTTSLLSTAGAINVSNLISTGAVTVSGTSVDILSNGALTFTAADATAGDLTIDAAGDLTLSTTDATGAVTLRSRNAALTTNGPISGTSMTLSAGTDVTVNSALTATSLIDITAGGAIITSGPIDPTVLRMTARSITIDGPATGGTVTLSSSTDITLNAALTATATLDMTAGGTIAVNALASGPQITATSADIAIGNGGQLGQRGNTQSVSLSDSAGTSPSFVGGTGGTGGYSLDATELLRVFADSAIRFSVSGATPATVTVGNLALAFGPNGNIGTGGTLALSSAGRIAVSGDVALTTASGTDTLQVNAGRLDIATDTGGIALLGGTGTPQGTLGVNAGTFAVATSGTLAQLAPGGSVIANTALMDTPSAAKGGVTAGAINADVTQGIYVQNTGATTAYADRRGFTTNALAIGTTSNATQIVINGVTFDTAGNAVTGPDTVGTITINGSAPAAGGQFNPFSSVNGCIIGLRCGAPIGEPVVPAKPDLAGPPDPPGAGTNGNPSLVNDAILQVEVRNSDPATLLPLVDEPVTGVGNEDLWGDRCASNKEACEGGN